MTSKYAKLVLAVSAAWLMASTAYAGDQPMKWREGLKARLERLENRLEIKPSQQAAWGDFQESVERLPLRKIERPGKDADAAAIARFRAERAKVMAERFSKIAETTAKLESVLTEDQRKIFDEASRKSLERMRRHHMEGEQK